MVAKTLTAKRQAFVEHYCTDANWNAAAALRMAGFSKIGANGAGARMLAIVSVQEAIEKKKAELYSGEAAKEEEVRRNHRLAQTLALAKGDLTTFTRNNEDLGKTLDMYGERHISEGTDAHPLTPAQRKRYEVLAREENIRLAQERPEAKEA